MIGNPSTGPKGEAFKGSLVSPRKFNSAVVRNQMEIVNRPDYMARIDKENINETQRNHVYWHGGDGANYAYAHYMDNWGYHWYGWYSGDQFFWTRNDDGRWWWYDTGYNRWCFYNDNYWWWQDPYHVGELYAYNDDSYIPANSADDQVVVTGQEQTSDMVYSSQDGMRTVKVAQGDGDAFLYDTANPPAFDPVYMASGVQKRAVLGPEQRTAPGNHPEIKRRVLRHVQRRRKSLQLRGIRRGLISSSEKGRVKAGPWCVLFCLRAAPMRVNFRPVVSLSTAAVKGT